MTLTAKNSAHNTRAAYLRQHRATRAGGTRNAATRRGFSSRIAMRCYANVAMLTRAAAFARTATQRRATLATHATPTARRLSRCDARRHRYTSLSYLLPAALSFGHCSTYRRDAAFALHLDLRIRFSLPAAPFACLPATTTACCGLPLLLSASCNATFLLHCRINNRLPAFCHQPLSAYLGHLAHAHRCRLTAHDGVRATTTFLLRLPAMLFWRNAALA